MDFLNKKITHILNNSFKESNRLGCSEITPDHILLSILNYENNIVIETIEQMGFDIEDISSKIESFLRFKIKNPQIIKKILILNETSKRIINNSQLESYKLRDSDISEEHIVLSILRDKEIDSTKILNNLDLTYKKFKEILIKNKKQINMSATHEYGDSGEPKINKTNNKSQTPILDNFSRDLTDLAIKGNIDPIIGRDEEIERVSQILSRRKKNNPMLIGEPGCVLSDTKIVVRKISNLTTHNIINK